MSRDDIKGLGQAPKAYENFLIRIGGKNTYGEPLFRLVLAENRFMQSGGVWWDWPEGTSVTDMGGVDYGKLIQMMEAGASIEAQNEFHASQQNKTPLRRIREVRWVRKYSCKGWVLEKWYPASQYGARGDWYAGTTDGVPDLGPFPDKGDYEFIAGPDTGETNAQIPSFDDLHAIIRAHYLYLGATPEQRRKQRELEAKEAEERENREMQKRLIDKDKETHLMLTSSSLAASRWRNETAATMGITGHVGIEQPVSY